MNLRPVRLLLFLLMLVPLLAAQEPRKDDARPNFPLQQWLSRPDQQDFKWRVEMTSPRLTFQQRNPVQVRAYLDVPPAADVQHDFYFVLKVADEKGNWLEDGSYNHYPLPPGLGKKNEIQYSTGIYAKPGKYTAALILYDAATQRGNVWHKPFEVHARTDSLAEMDRDIPAIEFISEVPNDALAAPAPEYVVRGDPRRGRFGPGGRRGISGIAVINDVSDEEWPPGHGKEFLPVRVPRPLRVDVVLNLAPSVNETQQRRNDLQQYRAVAGSVLQVGAVLSHLGVEPGCVRVSAIDLSKLAVVFDQVDGQTADWDKLTAVARKIDHNTVSVGLLGNKNAIPDFLGDYLAKLTGDNSGCDAGAKTERTLLVVSHDFEFPSGAHDRQWQEPCACRVMHLRIGSSGSDDVDKFLKPANPKRIDVRTPEQFRRALTEIMDELSGGRERER